MKKYIGHYRQSINPPYSRKDLPAVLGTIVLIAFSILGIYLLNLQNQQEQSIISKASEPGSLPIVSVKSPNKIVSYKQNKKAKFSIRRNGKKDSAINVYYVQRSTLDEENTPLKEGTATIPNGKNEVDIDLEFIPGNQDISLSIKENEFYELGPDSNEIIQIIDAENDESPDLKRPVIVTLNNTEPENILNANALDAKHIYKNTIKGFSARLNKQQIEKLRSDPNVVSIEDDRLMSIQAQSFSTGTKRVGLPSNTDINFGSGYQTNIDVAVLDTGIDINHPDLNVVGGKACVSGNSSFIDDNGHGTKVSGHIGARDNDFGVVGMAPGARLWSVKVADSGGWATWSNMICGFDFVTANAATIKVVNMSIAGSGGDGACTSSSLHNAVCRTVSKGVTVVVASGNNGKDASTYVPAAYDEVFTVGAIVDSDGKPGGLGASTSYGPDDSLATFSNFGTDIDFVAPGYSILTTTRGGGYGGGSGTSYSSPIVAGAAAFYLSKNPTASPAQVKQALISKAILWNSTWGYKQIRQSDIQPLIWTGSSAPDSQVSPTTQPTSTPTPTSIPTATPMPPTSTTAPTNTPSPSGTGTNLLLNPSFEATVLTSSGTKIANWSAGIRDTSVFRTGTASIRFDNAASGPYSWQKPPLSPSKTYTFQGWVKTNNVTGGAGGTMRYVNIPGNLIMATGVGGTKDWTFISKTFTTPPDWTSSSRLDIYAFFTSTGSVWIDDVALCEGACK